MAVIDIYVYIYIYLYLYCNQRITHEHIQHIYTYSKTILCVKEFYLLEIRINNSKPFFSST